MGEITRRSLLTGMAGLAGLAVAGCTSAPGNTFVTAPPEITPVQPGAVPETPTPSAPPVDTTPRWPLTGVPFKAGDKKKAAHPAIGCKVPIEMRSFPQSGVADADLVFVEAQGNSYDGTRLNAVFHSTWPKLGANPIRSARPVDLALMAPLKAGIASSGAYPWVIKYFNDHKKDVKLWQKYGDSSDRWQFLLSRGGWWSGGPMRDKAVVAMPGALSRDTTLNKGKVPPVYLQYALPDQPDSAASGQSAKQLTVTFAYSLSGYKTAEYHRWDWDEKSGTWLASIRFPKKTASSAQPPWKKWTTRESTRVAADNVMVLFCKWYMGFPDGYGPTHKEPMYSMIDGHDAFIYFHGGKYVKGTWTKGAIGDRFQFTLDDGTPLAMAPGKTWILMPQHNAPVDIK